MEKIKEPTIEQIKALWEWCGFTELHTNKEWNHLYWESPSKDWCYPVPPAIDLNNLFRFAVPKLKGTIRVRIAPIRLMQLRRDKPPKPLQWSVCIDGNQVGYNHFSEDPALALFWAIYEAMHHAN